MTYNLDYVQDKRDLHREAEICRRYRSGLSVRAVGRIFGISGARVHQVLVRAAESRRARLDKLPHPSIPSPTMTPTTEST